MLYFLALSLSLSLYQQARTLKWPFPMLTFARRGASPPLLCSLRLLRHKNSFYAISDYLYSENYLMEIKMLVRERIPAPL